MARTRVRVTGTVQGVGFRPFVYRHAVSLGLTGFVLNDSAGVLIEVEGDDGGIAELTRLLADDPPPLARVATIECEAIVPSRRDREFRIVESTASSSPSVPVSVDSATCAPCLAEVDDPTNRRYRYPFTNCTDCGPRYTIVRSVPYDRPATTMARFTMCLACQREYDDPADRRFHAQPNACPRCGPQLSWRDASAAVKAQADEALIAAVTAVRSGAIVAIKGIGGYHLAVDASDASAVAELRRRKRRDDKPFAIMAPDLAAAHRLCLLDAASVTALTSIRRPIVLAERRADADVADAVAPGLRDLGILLPYSPLHHLLLRDLGRSIVLTSGNLSDEPIAHDDKDAVNRLGSLVDGLLTHDRPIHIRCDDSVARGLTSGRIQMLRRSRGYAPEPIRLPVVARRQVLAVGAELKNTIAVAKDHFVVASHHIGDLEHLAAYGSFRQALTHLCHLYGVTPEVVAHDLHPEYLSTKLALELDVATLGVQHHHAHVAACLVDNEHGGPVLGVAFDGLGFGADGTLWGGELLVADLHGYERVGHLRPVVMPGGVAAIREPWRMAAAWATAATDLGGGPAWIGGVDASKRDAVFDLVAKGGGPVTTSVGRLFDAVAALLGGRQRVSYEAQAAIELETMARSVDRHLASSFPGTVGVAHVDGMAVFDPAPLLAAIIDARDAGTPPPLVAAGFHTALGRASALLAAELADAHALDTVALTGGVFQNALFAEIVQFELEALGKRVLVHRAVPPNDGGISIGQAAVAAARPG
ncbi:MAG: carbamoyltransferase HypF [Acidimicrobiales bacterium]